VFEEGRCNPKFTTLIRLARALDLSSLDQLMRARLFEV